MSSAVKEGRLLVVVGATGNQGGAVLNHFLEHNTRFAFKLRGITRNVDSKASKRLSKLGVEMVKADLDDEPSIAKAFTGATHIFANTDSNQWIFKAIECPAVLAPGQTPCLYAETIELAHGRNIIQAAASTKTLQRFVWSSLPGPRKWSNGKYNRVSHFDVKEGIADMLRATPEVKDKLSVLIVGFYATNALYAPQLYGPQKQKDGSFEMSISMPGDIEVPIADVEVDLGIWTDTLFQAEPGINLVGATEVLSWTQWLGKWAKHNKVKASYRIAGAEEFANRLPGMRDALLDELAFIAEFGFTGGNADVLLPDDLRARGFEMKQSSIDDQIERTDWSRLL